MNYSYNLAKDCKRHSSQGVSIPQRTMKKSKMRWETRMCWLINCPRWNIIRKQEKYRII